MTEATKKKQQHRRFGRAFREFAEAFRLGGAPEFKDLSLYEIAPKSGAGESVYAWATSKHQAGLAAINLLFDIGKISGSVMIVRARQALEPKAPTPGGNGNDDSDF